MRQENWTDSRRYYIDGSTVRKREYAEAAPRRREYAEPRRREKEYEVPVRRKRPVTYHKAAVKAEKSLAFDLKYTMFLTVAMVIMLVACVNMLRIQGKVEKQQKNIQSLQLQIQTIEDDNAALEDSLKNMYTLDDIYDIATSQLGMVYAQKGQIVYYESADEDYVNQYHDVPEAR